MKTPGINTAGITTAALVLLCGLRVCSAQHCPPILESYLRTISVKHADDSLQIRCEYFKLGGQPKPHYQAYVVAYLDKHAAKVPAAAPHDLLDPAVAVVLHTQLVARNKEGGYDLELKIGTEELVSAMVKQGGLVRDATAEVGWERYKDRIRLAIFVPFLEDKKYSVLAGLPEERHECNYAGDRALLFQPLPYALRVTELTGGTHQIQINGDKPAKPVN